MGNVVDMGRMGKMEMAWLQGAGLPWEKQKTHPAPTDDNCHSHSLHCCHVSLQHPEGTCTSSLALRVTSRCRCRPFEA